MDVREDNADELASCFAGAFTYTHTNALVQGPCVQIGDSSPSFSHLKCLRLKVSPDWKRHRC